METKAELRLKKLQEQIDTVRRKVARENAAARSRIASKAKQCAMITFNVLVETNPDVIRSVEAQLQRPRDKAAFAEWRAALADTTAGPSVENPADIATEQSTEAAHEIVPASRHVKF